MDGAFPPGLDHLPVLLLLAVSVEDVEYVGKEGGVASPVAHDHRIARYIGEHHGEGGSVVAEEASPAP